MICRYEIYVFAFENLKKVNYLLTYSLTDDNFKSRDASASKNNAGPKAG